MQKALAAVEAYLTTLRDIRATGSSQPETSLYPALANLLNDVAKASGLKQLSLMQMANQGAGFPDGGIFGRSQYRQRDVAEPLLGQVPEHGVIEAKPVADDAWLTADTRQVSRYWERYRQVLVTNFRDFLLLGEDSGGQPANLESFRFADSASSFWQQAQHPRKLAQDKGEQFAEFLVRVLLIRAKLADPAVIAELLASYARDARFRVEHKDAPGLLPLRTALEEALGLKFEGEKGDHFFRATLVQTLFYGIFSAWVLWHREKPGRTDEFDWRDAAHYLRLPMLAALFEQVSMASKLRELELIEVLDRAGAVLNRVVRADFFSKFDEGLAVLYFYEPFLKAYDPDLRKELGVWYTPPEIVKYMVARVDHVLRTELDIEDGLADERVYVLDPACGTGAYLVEVVDHIAENVRKNKGEGLIASEVRRALRERVFGFEILPAPLVVSHLQLGLALKRHGATFGPKERAGVYLTNALTGWEPPDGEAKERLRQMDAFPELKAERDAAYEVKRDKPILVVLGNPPYNGYAGVAVEEERDLSNAYRTTRRAPKPQGQGLNDLYVRFFRMAESRIVEKTHKGIVCFISNYSWLDGLSFTGMRERYLDTFDSIWIDNLHGDRTISEYAPDGRTSETVFAIGSDAPGITIGTAITLLSLTETRGSGAAKVRFRDWDQACAADRRQALLSSLSDTSRAGDYAELDPRPELGFPLKPCVLAPGYLMWPSLPLLLPIAFPGIKTSRDDFLVDIDRDRLEARLNFYFDKSVGHERFIREYPSVMTSASHYDPVSVRVQLQKQGINEGTVVRYCYRPFDVRWLYWEADSGLLDRSRPDYIPHVFTGNPWLEARQHQPREDFDRGYVTSALADNFANGLSTFFPMRLGAPAQQSSTPRPFNLSDAAEKYITALSAGEELLFYHCVAVMRAPAYAVANRCPLKLDWPRIPLPDKRELLEASAALGREVAGLLDSESEVRGVTTGRIRPELTAIARPSKDGGGSLDPDKDFAVTAGWGHAGKGGVTMPGKGDAREREYLPDEKKAIVEAVERLGLTQKEVFAQLGKTTFDIYLNGTAFWKNVPKGMWEYHIGGYQVMKKWLSYREEKLLGRPLKSEEVEHVMNTCRRLAAILLLGPRLDVNYQAVKAHVYSWPTKATG